MHENILKKVLETLEKTAVAHDLELVDTELAGTTQNPVLRIYLDKVGGITIDDIAAAHAWINPVIDELDPFRGSYMLEVSSPGIDRPLRTFEHFRRFAGEKVQITTKPQLHSNNRSKWTGTLLGVEDDQVIIKTDNATHRLAFADIKKAHVKGQVDFNQSIHDENHDGKEQ